MRGPAPHTAEDATPRELWSASLRLLFWLTVLVLLVIPLVRELPLGRTARTGILAWLLVALALYWLYAGLGYRALLLLQLGLFSTAAALLSGKALLVAAGVPGFDLVREVARAVVVAGGVCAGANLGGMLLAVLRRQARPGRAPKE